MAIVKVLWPILGLVATVAWTLARYPDRAETEMRGRIFDDRLEAIGASLRALRDEQITYRVRLDDIDRAIGRAEKAQDKLDTKLDKILQRRTP